MKKLLSIRNLKKSYYDKYSEIEAINNISLDIYKNEWISIVGPSGCGKTTLLSILANLENKTNGKIIKNNNQIGYMLQNDALFPWLNVLDNCTLGLKIKKQLNPKTKKNVIEMLKTYNLYNFINKYPDSLSGGMRQKVALIRTLSINPDILLLDEPFSALDYQTRLTLSDDIYNIIKKENKTVIHVTHDIAEAISLADRIIVLGKRPTTIKNIYEIKLNNRTIPSLNRKDNNFYYYYDMIWRDIDE